MFSIDITQSRTTGPQKPWQERFETETALSAERQARTRQERGRQSVMDGVVQPWELQLNL